MSEARSPAQRVATVGWVLPGHGERFHADSPAAMRRELERCIRRSALRSEPAP